MNHSTIPVIELPEGGAAPLAGLRHQRALRLFRPIYWYQEWDNALHMILAKWKDAAGRILLTAGPVNGLHTRIKQPVRRSVLRRAEA